MTTYPAKHEAIRTRGYIEAVRYMNNADRILHKSAQDGDFYADSKYVSSACGIAYRGVLVALDAYFELCGIARPQGRKRPSIDYYRRNLAELDKYMGQYLHTAYSILHLDGYYGLVCDARAINVGFDSAHKLISLIKPAADLPPEAFVKPSPMERLRQFVMAMMA